VRDQLDALGATWNAHTAIDHRAYSAVAPPGALPQLRALSAALLLAPLAGVDGAVVDVERNVVRRESELRGRAFGDVAAGELARRLFPPEHPYARLGGDPVPSADLAALRT
jgi:predicted Zn-dependent peptidase